MSSSVYIIFSVYLDIVQDYSWFGWNKHHRSWSSAWLTRTIQCHISSSYYSWTCIGSYLSGSHMSSWSQYIYRIGWQILRNYICSWTSIISHVDYWDVSWITQSCPIFVVCSRVSYSASIYCLDNILASGTSIPKSWIYKALYIYWYAIV